jgi:hypothetical protein
VSDAISAQYEEEIRDYLLGRLGREHTTRESLPVSAELPTPPILSWWIFEGRRYRGLEQCLALEFDRVLKQATLLRATYNPHWRFVQAPEGDVDWVATAFVSVTSGSPEYVCKTSKVGLSPEERATLDGWLLWLGQRWAGYVQEVNPPQGAPESVPWKVMEGVPPTFRQLRRWAYVAKRSRWPLLRNVIAETLRCEFEPQLLDALPLPSDHATLFELVCIVRILRALEPAPREIRWLNIDVGQNTIATGLGTVHYQLTIGRSQVLAGSPFDQASAEAVQRFGVSVPGRIDGLFRFKKPWNGFAGILLEAKSGMQGPDAALFQLLCYARVLSRERMGPLLILGVTEADIDAPEDCRVARENLGGADVWSFSSLRNLKYALATWNNLLAKDPLSLC